VTKIKKIGSEKTLGLSCWPGESPRLESRKTQTEETTEQVTVLFTGPELMTRGGVMGNQQKQTSGKKKIHGNNVRVHWGSGL